jgi:hypothetical protein
LRHGGQEAVDAVPLRQRLQQRINLIRRQYARTVAFARCARDARLQPRSEQGGSLSNRWEQRRLAGQRQRQRQQTGELVLLSPAAQALVRRVRASAHRVHRRARQLRAQELRDHLVLRPVQQQARRRVGAGGVVSVPQARHVREAQVAEPAVAREARKLPLEAGGRGAGRRCIRHRLERPRGSCTRGLS